MDFRGCLLTAWRALPPAVLAFYSCVFSATAADSRDAADQARVGMQQTYEIRYRSEGYTELGAAIGAAPGGKGLSKHNLLGTLRALEIFTILERRNTGGFRASVRFQRPVVGIQVDSQPQPQSERQVAEVLGHLVYVYLEAQGRVERFEFPKEYSSTASNFVKAIISTQQFAIPSNRQTASTWDTQETSASGKYSAHYEVLGVSGPLTRVRKTISRAAASRAADRTNSATPVQVLPQGRIELDIATKTGVVQNLESASHEDILVADHVLAAQNTVVTAHIVSTLRLSEQDLAAARREFTARSGALSATVQSDPGAALAGEKAMQQGILGVDSVQSLLRALSDIDSQSIPREQQTSVYLKVKALIYVRPGDVAVLAKGLTVANLASPSAEMITTALAAVGSPEAQEALCAAIRSRKDDSQALTTLVPVLGSLQQPTQRVVALLEELSRSSSRDIRSMTLLALGGAGKNLAQASRNRSNAIVRNLAARLASSPAAEDKTTVLLALGNTGAGIAKTVILGQKSDPSPVVRRTVSTALAGFQSADSDRALCEMLKSDEDAQVRASAAQALAVRNRVIFVKETLLQAAQKDKADNVRLASVFALTDLVSKEQAVREIITTVAQRDISEVVRKQAEILLQGNNSQK